MRKRKREHPLLKYLNRQGKSQAAFAEQIGVSRSFITEVVKDHCRFGAEMMMTVVDATGGEVTPNDLLSRRITPRRR
jgi:DNA-binding transcriptional regulator YdaS (Cro superfamily)